MIQLFSGMQSSLSMVYDREMGNMRTLLVSPLPRWYLLIRKLLAGVGGVARRRSTSFLAIAWFWGVKPPPLGYLTGAASAVPGRADAGLDRPRPFGLLSGSWRTSPETMNFVIFPMFFMSSALYPLWRVREASPILAEILRAQPLYPRRRTGPLRARWRIQSDRVPAGRLPAAVPGDVRHRRWLRVPARGLMERRGAPG